MKPEVIIFRTIDRVCAYYEY